MFMYIFLMIIVLVLGFDFIIVGQYEFQDMMDWNQVIIGNGINGNFQEIGEEELGQNWEEILLFILFNLIVLGVQFEVVNFLIMVGDIVVQRLEKVVVVMEMLVMGGYINGNGVVVGEERKSLKRRYEEGDEEGDLDLGEWRRKSFRQC